jgi:hypothetical protein
MGEELGRRPSGGSLRRKRGRGRHYGRVVPTWSRKGACNRHSSGRGTTARRKGIRNRTGMELNQESSAESVATAPDSPSCLALPAEAFEPASHRPGTLEIWDVVVVSEGELPSLWIRHVMGTPLKGAGIRTGWICMFDEANRAKNVRFDSYVGSAPRRNANAGESHSWFDTGDVRVSRSALVGRVSGVVWELAPLQSGEPLWMTPRKLWNAGPVQFGEVVVPLPSVTGEIRIEGHRRELVGARGFVSHRRSQGHPRRWTRAYFWLDDKSFLAASVVEGARRVVGWTRPAIFLAGSVQGERLPKFSMAPGALKFARRNDDWRVWGGLGRRRVDVRVSAPVSHVCANEFGEFSGLEFCSRLTCRGNAEVRLLRHREGPLWTVERAWRVRSGAIAETSECLRTSPADASTTSTPAGS